MADGIQVTPESLREKLNEIVSIDEQLDAASGSAAAGKRAIANEYVRDNEEVVNSLVEQVSTFLRESADPVKVAVLYGFHKQLDDQFDADVQKFLDAEAENRKTDVPTLSEDQLTQLSEQRKKLSGEYKALRNILEMFLGEDNPEVTSIPEPKRRTGARGPRGPRAISKYAFSIGGTQVPPSENSLSAIAVKTGFEATTREVDGETKKVSPSKALKEFLVTQVVGKDDEGNDVTFNLSDPPAEWSVTLPNGQTLSGVRMAEDEDDDEDENDTE